MRSWRASGLFKPWYDLAGDTESTESWLLTPVFVFVGVCSVEGMVLVVRSSSDIVALKSVRLLDLSAVCVDGP